MFAPKYTVAIAHTRMEVKIATALLRGQTNSTSPTKKRRREMCNMIGMNEITAGSRHF